MNNFKKSPVANIELEEEVLEIVDDTPAAPQSWWGGVRQKLRQKLQQRRAQKQEKEAWMAADPNLNGRQLYWRVAAAGTTLSAAPFVISGLEMAFITFPPMLAWIGLGAATVAFIPSLIKSHQQWRVAKTQHHGQSMNVMAAASLAGSIALGTAAGYGAGGYVTLFQTQNVFRQDMLHSITFQGKINNLVHISETDNGFNPRYFTEKGFLIEEAKEEFCMLSNQSADVFDEYGQQPGTRWGVKRAHNLLNKQYNWGCLSLQQLEEKQNAVTQAYLKSPSAYEQYINAFPLMTSIGESLYGVHALAEKTPLGLTEREACQMVFFGMLSKDMQSRRNARNVDCASSSDNVVSYDKIEYFQYKFQSGVNP